MTTTPRDDRAGTDATATIDEPAPAPLRLFGGLEAPHVSPWTFAGHDLEVRYWSEEEWAAVPEPARDPKARRMSGGGWCRLAYADG